MEMDLKARPTAAATTYLYGRNHSAYGLTGRVLHRVEHVILLLRRKLSSLSRMISRARMWNHAYYKHNPIHYTSYAECQARWLSNRL